MFGKNKKSTKVFSSTIRYFAHVFLMALASVASSVILHVKTIFSNGSLFTGVTLLLIGLLNFESDKYCDGSSSDYLSCTRPTTYYFFDWLDITLIIAGIFLIILWRLNQKKIAQKK